MTSTLEVLLVEDDREQADLIVDTAKLCRLDINWSVVGDGETALAWLRRGPGLATAVRPGLVLLDLHLPRLGGVDVLKAIKADPELRGLPVIIMSSSRDERDVEAAYTLGANCYIAKPSSYEGLVSLVKFVEAFLSLPQGHPTSEPRAHTLN